MVIWRRCCSISIASGWGMVELVTTNQIAKPTVPELLFDALLFQHGLKIVAVDKNAGGTGVERRFGAVLDPFVKHFDGLGAVTFGRLIASQLYGITATNPWVLLLMMVTLTVVAALACMVPARRAANVDVMKILSAP